MHLYPLLFVPIVKKMIWGQESWDISCRVKEMGVIENGVYAGMAFDAYLGLDRDKTLGTRLAPLSRFPVLVKIITAEDALSVQVHPDDAYAQGQAEIGGGVCDSGKSEMWYILEAPKDGHLIIGLRDGVTREELLDAFSQKGKVAECLHRLSVEPGDMVNIPAGLIHALTPGAVIAEIQQNSDTTYRLYDYERVGFDGQPRELHIGHALAVADFEGRIPKERVDGVHCPHFTVERYVLEEARGFASDPEAFHIILCAEGTVHLAYDGGKIKIPARRSSFIPAGMGKYTLRPEGRCVILFCTIP
ncbi:MAG: class I mannose-6-phosphate isomerase [Defluviitaleaceae bacterium]|nr:class I mannose-6-phosphate isomerase [Defluviitaleaceae bacterium]MCL2240425.1 class I mannose-6-phosphate isomerase [Defluviitaleaceae bacterium]